MPQSSFNDSSNTEPQGWPFYAARGLRSGTAEITAVVAIRNNPSTAGNSMTGSERLSPEPLPKKEAPPAVLGGREFWKCSESLKSLELQGFGHPSRTLEGKSRKRSESVSGVFPNFSGISSGKSQPYWGYGPG